MATGLREFESLSGKASQGYHLTQQACFKQRLKLKLQRLTTVNFSSIWASQVSRSSICHFAMHSTGIFLRPPSLQNVNDLNTESMTKENTVGSLLSAKSHQIRFPMGKRGRDISPWIFINLDRCLAPIDPATQPCKKQAQ